MYWGPRPVKYVINFELTGMELIVSGAFLTNISNQIYLRENIMLVVASTTTHHNQLKQHDHGKANLLIGCHFDDLI